MKVLEILVNLLQNEEEEEDLPEQVSVKDLLLALSKRNPQLIWRCCMKFSFCVRDCVVTNRLISSFKYQ